MKPAVPRLLRSPRRVLPGIAGLVVLGALAIYAPSTPGGDDGVDAAAGGPFDSATTLPTGGSGQSVVTTPEGTPVTTPDGRAVSQPGAVATGAAPGDAGTPGDQAAARATYQGVTDTSVKVVYGHQPESCGQDISAFQAMISPNPDVQKSTDVATEYLNKNALALFGADLPDAQRDALGTEGFYGRRIETVLAVDHGAACAEQSRADAQQAVETHKPFASVGGSDNEWDDVMATRGVVRVSGRPALDDFFTSRRPYVWGPITGASQINTFLAKYVSGDLAKSNTIDTGSIETSNRPRVFGIYHLDEKEFNRVVADLVDKLEARGVKVAKVIGYEPNVGTIGSQTTNAVLQFKAAGVTSILMAMDPIASLFLTQSSDSQSWYPEWITSTIGLMDNPVGPRTFMTPTQNRNAFGISVYFPSKVIREEEQEAYRAFKSLRPDEEVPSDFITVYNNLKVIARGIALAGEHLTPHTFESGYNAHCAPCVRTDPNMPLIGYGPGDYTAVDDAHKQRYDPDEPDYGAPKSAWQNGQPPRGAYVFLDGGRRYTDFG